MKVGVVIPLYNCEAFVSQALTSLLRQKMDCELAIVVTDDGSNDGGPDIVRAMAGENPEITMISQQNHGVSRARNVAIGHLPEDCDFVTFLDSDDVSPPDRLAAEISVLTAEPTVDFTYGKMMLVDGIDGDTLKPAADAKRATVRGVSTSAGLFRYPFLRRIGEFDEALTQAEDADFLFRAFEMGGAYRLTDTVAIYYRRHSGNATNDGRATVRGMMHAMQKSIARRKLNPGASIPRDIFDLRNASELLG